MSLSFGSLGASTRLARIVSNGSSMRRFRSGSRLGVSPPSFGRGGRPGGGGGRPPAAARPRGVGARRPARFLGGGEALGGGVEPLLDRVEQLLWRLALGRLSGAAHRAGSASSAWGVLALIGSASSAHKAAGEVQ